MAHPDTKNTAFNLNPSLRNNKHGNILVPDKNGSKVPTYGRHVVVHSESHFLFQKISNIPITSETNCTLHQKQDKTNTQVVVIVATESTNELYFNFQRTFPMQSFLRNSLLSHANGSSTPPLRAYHNSQKKKKNTKAINTKI